MARAPCSTWPGPLNRAEVAAAVEAHPSVRRAAVVAREDLPGGAGLVAYVEVDEDPGADALRAAARARLPEFMLPTAFVALSELPRTANGKLDRAALPVPELASGSAAPRTPTEELVAVLWADLLGLPEVGREDDFFALGGHSLAATRLAGRLRQAFGVELPLAVLFEAPTVAGTARENRRRALRRTPRLAAAADHRACATAARGTATLVRAAPAFGSSPSSTPRAPLTICRWSRSWPASSTFAPSSGPGSPSCAATRACAPSSTPRPASRCSASRQPGQRELPVVDLSGLGAAAEAAAARVLRRGTRIPFDLSLGPPAWAFLVRLDTRRHAACLTLHHLVADGWSMGILVRELALLYDGFQSGRPAPLEPLSVQVPDFAVWQREHGGHEAQQRDLEYWRGKLAGIEPLTELPTDRPRPAVRGPDGGVRTRTLVRPSVKELDALSRRRGTTRFMALLAAFEALMARLTGRSRFTVGTPVAGRARPELEPVVGFFVNTLALPAEVDREATFGDLLEAVRGTALEAWAHQSAPFDRLVEELVTRRDPSVPPLVQVVLAFQDLGFERPDLPGLEVEARTVHTGGSKFDLSFIAWTRGDRFSLGVETASDLFDPSTADRLIGAWEVLLEAAVRAEDTAIAALPLLAATERQQLLVEWNDRPRSVPLEAPERSFARTAREAPDAVAAIAGDGMWSRAGLADWVRRLADRLVAAGARPEERVAVVLERSAALLAAELAVLETGAAFVPLDPAHPPARLASLLADAGPVAVIARGGELPEAPAALVDVDQWRPGGRSRPAASPRPGSQAPALATAYAIYTSGSTGRPKAVTVSRAALAHLVAWHLDAYGTGSRAPLSGERWAAVASPAFDASVWEAFPALAAGATLYVMSDEVRADPEAVREALLAWRIRSCFVPTPLAESLLALEWPSDGALRRLLTGGDRLTESPTPDLPWQLVNHYGPTEAAVVATAGAVAAELPEGGERKASPTAPPSIGRAIAGTRAFVVDPSLAPLPTGVAGELVLGGAGLARGYLGRPARTAASFVPDPWAAGERLYRTGDRVRLRPDGQLDFLGRLDDQVQVRGVRVEPGEVEAALAEHPSVAAAAVVARADLGAGTGLAAYVTPARGTRFDRGRLAAHLRERLPAAVRPSLLEEIDSLPLTPNGKIDRRALAARALPEGAELVSAGRAPRGPVEERVAELWAELLGEPPAADDDFFAAGGHSLAATRLVARVREAFGVRLPLRALFREPTVAAIAVHVESSNREDAENGPALERVSRDAPLPASFGQRRMWFLHQLESGSAAYNVPAAFRLQGELSRPALVSALDALAARHEILRTVLAEDGGEVVQVVAAPERRALRIVDLSGLGEGAARWAEAHRLLAAEARRPFDLSSEPPLRARLLALGGREHALALTVHHAAADGASMPILARDLGALYRAAATGTEAALPPLTVQYADYAAWQRALEAEGVFEDQLGEWMERLASLPAETTVPTDRPRPATPRGRGAVLRRHLAPAPGLAALARELGATPFMTSLALWLVLLRRHGAGTDLAVGTPVAGRSRSELADLVGFFVNTLVLRVDLSGEPTWRSVLERTRSAALDAFARQDLPFERLVEAIEPERRLSTQPLFQVLFAFQDAGPLAELGTALALEPLALGTGTAKFDLSPLRPGRAERRARAGARARSRPLGPDDRRSPPASVRGFGARRVGAAGLGRDRGLAALARPAPAGALRVAGRGARGLVHGPCPGRSCQPRASATGSPLVDGDRAISYGELAARSGADGRGPRGPRDRMRGTGGRLAPALGRAGSRRDRPPRDGCGAGADRSELPGGAPCRDGGQGRAGGADHGRRRRLESLRPPRPGRGPGGVGRAESGAPGLRALHLRLDRRAQGRGCGAWRAGAAGRLAARALGRAAQDSGLRAQLLRRLVPGALRHSRRWRCAGGGLRGHAARSGRAPRPAPSRCRGADLPPGRGARGSGRSGPAGRGAGASRGGGDRGRAAAAHRRLGLALRAPARRGARQPVRADRNARGHGRRVGRHPSALADPAGRRPSDRRRGGAGGRRPVGARAHRSAGGALPRRLGGRPRLSRRAGGYRRALRPGPRADDRRRPPVPHGGPGPLARRRPPRVPRPCRRADQGAGVPGRAGGGRSGARDAPCRRAGRRGRGSRGRPPGGLGGG